MEPEDPVVLAAAAQCVASPLSLEMIPALGMFLLLEEFDPGCDFAVPPGNVLLRNTSSELVRIDTIQVSKHFFATAEESLPRVLAPGERLSVELRFESERDSDALGTMVVSGPRGCAAVKFFGHPIDPTRESFITLHPWVVDFGHVPVGSASEPVTITILNKNVAGGATLRGFEVSPSAAFELVDPPSTEIKVEGCLEAKLRLRFLAPKTTQFVEGYLSYESVAKDSSGREFAGSGVYNLIGNSD
jgi:hypothetical protein